jgi:hypothetical protein
MEFHEKRPVFMAAQFTGKTESVDRIEEIINISSYTITNEKGQATLDMVQSIPSGGNEPTLKSLKLQRHDWLVLTPAGEVLIVESHHFRQRFEGATA